MTVIEHIKDQLSVELRCPELIQMDKIVSNIEEAIRDLGLVVEPDEVNILIKSVVLEWKNNDVICRLEFYSDNGICCEIEHIDGLGFVDRTRYLTLDDMREQLKKHF